MTLVKYIRQYKSRLKIISYYRALLQDISEQVYATLTSRILPNQKTVGFAPQPY
jgi:hypothetical protein